MLTDMGRLCALTSACKNSTEDRIWMLREDPSYYAETGLELMEYRPELLKGLRCGCPHRSGDHDLLWARILRDTAANCYIDFCVRSEIHGRMNDLNRIAMQHELGLHPMELNTELPVTLLESLV